MVTRKRSGAAPQDALNGAKEHGESHALEENIEAIKNWERASVYHRSRAERFSDAITRIAASGPILFFHVAWFAFWVVANANVIPSVKPFDPFPFPLLTMTVSLEAIFLSLFVLASQNRLTAQADKRSNLDLQIDLLAEREMTVILRLLQDIARHLDIPLSVTSAQIRDLAKTTDVPTLVDRMDEFEQPPTHAPTETPGRTPSTKARRVAR